MSDHQNMEQKTASGKMEIPWYYIVIAMVIVTAFIIVFFSSPLETSPDQSFAGEKKEESKVE